MSQVVVLLSGIREELLRAFRSCGLYRLLHIHQIFREMPTSMSSTLDAVRQAYDYLDGDFCQTCPKRQDQGDLPPSWYYVI